MIKNIIFDLGGVILNIDYGKTVEAFVRLGVSGIDRMFSQHFQPALFDDFETGKISEKDFRDGIRKLAGISLKDDDIDKAWNAMLLDLPAGRLKILQDVKRHYRVFLLSNTNAIHLQAFHRYLDEEGKKEVFNSVFEKKFYSHEIGFRKPSLEAFEYVIRTANIIPQETLFIDDTLQHIQGGQQAGLQTFWLDRTQNMTLADIFIDGRLK